MKYFKM